MHKAYDRSLREAMVLIRISRVGLGSELEGEFLDNLTRYNNTQNAVKLPDFRSNDSIQRQLVRRFANLRPRDGKRFQYRNKRTGERDSRYINIRMEEFAKRVHALHFGPIDCFGGSKYLFNLGEGGGYPKVFGDGIRVWEEISDKAFDFLAGSWFVCEQIDPLRKRVKSSMIEDEIKRIEAGKLRPREALAKFALERQWLGYYVVGELLRQKCSIMGLTFRDRLEALSDPKWTQRTSVIRDLEEYVQLGCDLLRKRYRNDMERETFTHRNWFRSVDTLRSIEIDCGDSWLMLKNLPDPL